MRVIQVLPTIVYGDGVSNYALAIKELLVSGGYETEIYAERFDSRFAEEYEVIPASELQYINNDDVIIYHLSIGTMINKMLRKLECRKMAIYHNVTPPDFFEEYNPIVYSLCKEGLEDVKALYETFDYCIAVSDFNREDLIRNGYKCHIDVCSTLISLNDYEKKPRQRIIEKYNDGKTNLIFVGRVAPNKKQEDIIAAFSCYQRIYEPDARLFIVGSSGGMELYQEQLDEYVRRLDVKNVVFTGMVLFDEILAYYKVADVFLCMSEHEGLCVPLVEAMYFNVPIIAYASTGVPSTLGGTGILLQEKDPLLTAGIINRIVVDKELKDTLIEKQRRRLEDFSYTKISERLKNLLTNFIKGSV